MPGKVIGSTMSIGYPGTHSRNPDCIISARPVSGDKPIQFGQAVRLNSDNTYSLFDSDGDMDNFAGVAVCEVKQATSYQDQNHVEYLENEIADVIERGAVCVKCNSGTPVSGGAVYVRVTENASIPNGVIGEFEADADGANTVKLTNCRWTTGRMDSNGVAEITILQRNNP